MTDLLVTGLVAGVVAAAVFGVLAYTLGRTSGLSEPIADGVPRGLPVGGPITSADVAQLRFDMALRGYRMAQVDAVLTRLAEELSQAQRRIVDLETVLQQSRGAPSQERDGCGKIGESAPQHPAVANRGELEHGGHEAADG